MTLSDLKKCLHRSLCLQQATENELCSAVLHPETAHCQFSMQERCCLSSDTEHWGNVDWLDRIEVAHLCQDEQALLERQAGVQQLAEVRKT